MSQNSLQNDLIVLYEKTREKVRGFQKKTYQSDMGILKEENQTLLECVKETIEKSEKCMQEVAGYVPEYASEMLSQIDSKRKREAAVIDHNMAMVAFFVPLMGGNSEYADEDIYGENRGDMESEGTWQQNRTLGCCKY